MNAPSTFQTITAAAGSACIACSAADAQAMISRYFGRSVAQDADEIRGFFTDCLITGRARFCDRCTFPVLGACDCHICAAVPGTLADIDREESAEDIAEALEPFLDTDLHTRMLQAARTSYARRIYRAHEAAGHAAEAAAFSILAQPLLKSCRAATLYPTLAESTEPEPAATIDGGF